MSEGGGVASFVVPVHPHTVLAPDMNPGWRALRDAYDSAAQTIRDIAVSYTHLTLPTNREV